MITPELKDIINQAIIAIFTLIILPTIPLVYKLVKAFVEAKIASIKDKGVKEAVEFAFRRLDFIVQNITKEISQTHPLPPNPTDRDRGARLAAAIKRIKDQLVDADDAVLRNSVKDLDRYLITKVEASRYDQKVAQGVKPKPSVAPEPEKPTT